MSGARRPRWRVGVDRLLCRRGSNDRHRAASAVGAHGLRTHLRARTLVLLVALLSFATVPARSAAAAAGPDSAYTNLFASLSDAGWVGGDATNSVALPDGRDCWIFSDTITSMSVTGLTFAHNSIAITGRGRPRVIADPMPQPSPDSYYWAGAALVHGSQIWEIAERIIQTGPGLWDLQFAATTSRRSTSPTGGWRQSHH